MEFRVIKSFLSVGLPGKRFVLTTGAGGGGVGAEFLFRFRISNSDVSEGNKSRNQLEEKGTDGGRRKPAALGKFLFPKIPIYSPPPPKGRENEGDHFIIMHCYD